jgi:hypothetical protein
MNGCENDRLLIPFSGQRDAVELCVSAAEIYPLADIHLLYIMNVGFRSRYRWPVAAARLLAEHFQKVERLIVADAGNMQELLIAEMPHLMDGLTSQMRSCVACQLSLSILGELIASWLGASMTDFIGSASGSMRRLFEDHEILGRRRRSVPRLSTLRHLSVPGEIEIDLSERCVLADNHAGTLAVLPKVVPELGRWLKEWPDFCALRNQSAGGTQRAERYIAQVIVFRHTRQ